MRPFRLLSTLGQVCFADLHLSIVSESSLLLRVVTGGVGRMLFGHCGGGGAGIVVVRLSSHPPPSVPPSLFLSHRVVGESERARWLPPSSLPPSAAAAAISLACERPLNEIGHGLARARSTRPPRGLPPSLAPSLGLEKAVLDGRSRFRRQRYQLGRSAPPPSLLGAFSLAPNFIRALIPRAISAASPPSPVPLVRPSVLGALIF